MYSHFTPCQHGHHELVSVLNRLAASRLQKQLQVWLAKGSKNKRAYSYQLEQCWYSKPSAMFLLQHHCSDKYVHSLSKRAMPRFASQLIAMHHAISKIRLALMVDDLVAWVLQMEWCHDHQHILQACNNLMSQANYFSPMQLKLSELCRTRWTKLN